MFLFYSVILIGYLLYPNAASIIYCMCIFWKMVGVIWVLLVQMIFPGNLPKSIIPSLLISIQFDRFCYCPSVLQFDLRYYTCNFLSIFAGFDFPLIFIVSDCNIPSLLGSIFLEINYIECSVNVIVFIILFFYHKCAFWDLTDCIWACLCDNLLSTQCWFS